MKYVKQHFCAGMKVSLPDVLNRMEDGIAAACGAEWSFADPDADTTSEAAEEA